MFAKNHKLASIAAAVSEVMEASAVKIQTPTGTKVLGTRYGNSAKAHRDQLADPFAGHKGPGKKDLEAIEKPKKESFNNLTKKLLATIEENKLIDKQINEVLKKDASAGDWIHDFVHSNNSMFEGKTKAERKKMALGAYYSKQNEQAGADLELTTTKDEAEDTAARKSIKAKPTENITKTDNLDPKYGRPNAFTACEEVEEGKKHIYSFKSFTEALIGGQKKIDKNHNNKIDGQDFAILRGKKGEVKKEEVELDEVLDKTKRTIDTLAGRTKKVPPNEMMDNGHASAKSELKSEEKEDKNIPFDGPYTKRTPDSVTDKSGATHTPMSRAKHLAQTALKKIKSDLKVK